MKPTTDSQVKQKEPGQVETVLFVLLSGIRIDRVQMWRDYRIADLRSRLSQVKEWYHVEPERRTKPGKRYREYWMENKFKAI